MPLTRLTSMMGKFKGAGSAILTRCLADGSPSKDPNDTYIMHRTGMGVVNASWAANTEELRDENHPDPIHNYMVSTTQTVGITTLFEDGYFDIYLKGGKIEENPDGTLTIPGISISIPEGGGAFELKPYKEGGETPVIVDTEPVFVQDVSTGEYYTKVTTDPQAGEYKLDAAGGEIVFSAADEGKNVLLTATYEAGKITRFVYNKTPTNTTFQLILAGWFYQYDETNLEYMNETYPAVNLASGEVASLARQLSPAATKVYTFTSVASKGAEGVIRATGQPPVQMDEA